MLWMTACSTKPEHGLDGPAAEPSPSVAAQATGENSPAQPEPPAPASISEIDLTRLWELHNEGNILLVDVRPHIYYSMGHLPGATNLPKRQYYKELPRLKADLDAAVTTGKPIVLYCQDADCPDAATVARMLARQGYKVLVYIGGWKEWKAAGLE